MSDTPRTDKESFYEGRAEIVGADFARQLERDLTKAKRLLEKAHFFMNAQAYEQDDCEEFCRDLADFLGKPS